jgi:hypothetical protein
MAQKAAAVGTVTHHGMVIFDFDTGSYAPGSGSGDWKVRPIPWPIFPSPPSLGQVLIEFDVPITGPYTVIISAGRTPDCPMLSANWGNLSANGFEVVLFDPVATLSYRTVRNGNFSFAVIQ